MGGTGATNDDIGFNQRFLQFVVRHGGSAQGSSQFGGVFQGATHHHDPGNLVADERLDRHLAGLARSYYQYPAFRQSGEHLAGNLNCGRADRSRIPAYGSLTAHPAPHSHRLPEKIEQEQVYRFQAFSFDKHVPELAQNLVLAHDERFEPRGHTEQMPYRTLLLLAEQPGQQVSGAYAAVFAKEPFQTRRSRT